LLHQTLPHNPDELQDLVRSLLTKTERLAAENAKLENRVDQLESELRLHRINRFKAQSEKAKALFGDMRFEQGDIFPEALAQVLKELGLEAEDEVAEP